MSCPCCNSRTPLNYRHWNDPLVKETQSKMTWCHTKAWMKRTLGQITAVAIMVLGMVGMMFFAGTPLSPLLGLVTLILLFSTSCGVGAGFGIWADSDFRMASLLEKSLYHSSAPRGGMGCERDGEWVDGQQNSTHQGEVDND